MGYGYDIDLRTKAVAAYESGRGSIDTVASIFGIGSATLKRWLWRKRDTSSLAPRPYGGGNQRKLSDADLAWMEQERVTNPDRTIREWRDAIAEGRGVSVSTAAVSRVLVKMGWTRKKGPHGERSRAE
jgi:transposase